MFYSALHFFCNLFVVLHCTALFVTVELFGKFSKADDFRQHPFIVWVFIF